MRHVRQTVRSLLLAALLCMALAVTGFAAGDDSVWLALSDTSGSTTAGIVTDTTVTDGVVELSYNSSALTYEGVEVSEAYAAMYSVNADETGVVRISWVAPGEYEAVKTGAELIRVNFTGEATAEDISLSGSVNNADGEIVAIRSEAVVKTVDTSALEEAIAKAEGLNSSDYTEESWAALEKALADGKAVLADADATQEEVDAAAKSLNDAIAALVRAAGSTAVDTSALEQAIAKAEGLKSSDYTKESWAALEKALADGKAVLADANATQEAVDAAAKSLNDAIAALVKAAGSEPSTGTSTNGNQTNGNQTSGSNSPKTGDSAPIGLILGLLICAAVVFAGLAVYRYRRERK